MRKTPAPPEDPCFVDQLPPGAPLPDRITPGAQRQPRDQRPGETVEQARKRRHDDEFGESDK